jgi:cytoskeletal protein CcmA (bactofilin family)
VSAVIGRMRAVLKGLKPVSGNRGVKLTPAENVISIIGPGMKVVGDCLVDGALRIEGTVQGNVRAGKSVVVGKDGAVEGDVSTQDAVIAGTIRGSLRAESRLEVKATSRIEGEVMAARIQLEEGAHLNGRVQMGDLSRTGSDPAPGPE